MRTPAPPNISLPPTRFEPLLVVACANTKLAVTTTATGPQRAVFRHPHCILIPAGNMHHFITVEFGGRDRDGISRPISWCRKALGPAQFAMKVITPRPQHSVFVHCHFMHGTTCNHHDFPVVEALRVHETKSVWIRWCPSVLFSTGPHAS